MLRDNIKHAKQGGDEHGAGLLLLPIGKACACLSSSLPLLLSPSDSFSLGKSLPIFLLPFFHQIPLLIKTSPFHPLGWLIIRLKEEVSRSRRRTWLRTPLATIVSPKSLGLGEYEDEEQMIR